MLLNGAGRDIPLMENDGYFPVDVSFRLHLHHVD